MQYFCILIFELVNLLQSMRKQTYFDNFRFVSKTFIPDLDNILDMYEIKFKNLVNYPSSIIEPFEAFR